MKSRLVVLSILFFPALADANNSEPRLIFHSGRQLTSVVGISAHFVPAYNLAEKLTPLAYLSLDVLATTWLTISPTVGWSFNSDEVIASVRLTPKYKRFHAWIDFEVQPQSWSSYWFAEFEIKTLEWLHFGVEEESWGNITDVTAMTHGAGVNMLLRPSPQFGVDVAVQVRRERDEYNPVLCLRAHLFL